jgi:hypothetical protein
MSGRLPIFPGQRERWAEPRPEPVSLELPGWSCRVVEPDEVSPNERMWTFERGEGRVLVTRWWDQPLDPGYPMALAGERTVRAGDREIRLVTTSLFDGAPKRVQIFWLRGKGHGVGSVVRVVCDHCDDAVEEVLRRVQVHW